MIHRKKLLSLLCAMCLTACATNQELADSAQALKIEPTMSSGNYAQSMYLLGRYYQGQNRYEQAITAYKKALAADSRSAEAYNGLGVVYSRMGNFDAAVEAFNAALNISPQAVHVYNNLGYAYYLQGDYEQAMTTLIQALAMEPDNKRVQTNIDLVNEKTGNPKAAVMKTEPVAARAADSEKISPASAQTKLHQPSQEDSGHILSASEAELKVVQVAPAVYRLERLEPDAALGTLSGKVKIEIANGNGVSGMARKVGGYLRHLGYAAARLTNQKPYKVVQSQIQYRRGYLQDAEKLQSTIHGQPEMVERNDMRPDIHLRLLLGRDMIGAQDFSR